jgi:hypothetical protein
MSEKQRQKKDGQDKNKKMQARHADHDVDHRTGTAPQSRANSQEGYGASSSQAKESSPALARRNAGKTMTRE